MNVLELVVFILASALIVTLLIISIRLGINNAELKAKLTQTYKDNIIFLNKIEELSLAQEAYRVEQNDDFLKFLSDSRTDAFNYIEEVQNRINNLVVAWNYHTTQMPPDGTSERKLYEAYSSLVEMLPKDTGND